LAVMVGGSVAARRGAGGDGLGGGRGVAGGHGWGPRV